MKGTISMIRSRALGSIGGKMGQFMKDSFLMTLSMEKEW